MFIFDFIKGFAVVFFNSAVLCLSCALIVLMFIGLS